MTLTEGQLQEAQRLRASGISYRLLGQRFGLSGSGAYKQLNPGRAKEYQRRCEAKPKRQDAKRDWARKVPRKACTRCGGPCNPRSKGLCRKCFLAAKRERGNHRRQRIAEFWSRGVSVEDMAIALDSTANAISGEIAHMRNMGWDLPYRRKGWKKDYCRDFPKKLNGELTNQQARRRLHGAIRNGVIVKPMRCECCHRETEVEGHHDDYSRPLDVEWLCQACHLTQHGKRAIRSAVT